MKIWDKIVEGVTRLANGESFGSLLGLTSPPADDGAHPGLRQIAFTIGVIALGAKMARADGEVSEIEAAAFRDFFQVPPGEERNVERFFNLAKRDVCGFRDLCAAARGPVSRCAGNPRERDRGAVQHRQGRRTDRCR